VLTIGNGSAGPVANKMFNAITDIQYGKTKDTMNWTMTL
ncbi:MAG: branched chain amino acid aminotransferase, partial [Deltaproteobacteria bacterium]|nr:branched chain amino acid aminotransferase [Deltaproteobacteria bacterium]